MRCSAYTSDGAPLNCTLKQDNNNINSFTIQIKRKRCVTFEQPMTRSMQQSKKAKTSSEIIGNTKKINGFSTSNRNLRKRKRDDEGDSLKQQNETGGRRTKNTAIVSLAKKAKQCESVQMGDVILCKIRGYAEWPCFVTGLDGNSVDVKFFGDNTTFSKKLFRFWRII